jgi:hypothetical protein
MEESKMQTINCYIPLKLRLRGEPGEDDWAALEEALVAQYTRTLSRSIAELTRSRLIQPGIPEAVAEPFAQERSGPEGYWIPSYEHGQPTQVPTSGSEVAGASSTGKLMVGFTMTKIMEWIRKYFPATRGRPRAGVYHGVYATLQGTNSPMLYYLTINEQGQEVLESIFLYVELDKKRGAMLLQTGSYTVIFEPFGRGVLYHDNQREKSTLMNPDNMDIAVNFIVPTDLGFFERSVPHYAYRFYPRMQILEPDHEPIMSVGAESIYYSDVQIWGVDESGQWYHADTLAFVFASLDFTWEIWQLKTPPGKKRPVLRELVRAVHSKDAFLRHTWAAEGTYEISCEVTVRQENVSPEPVKDTRRQRVVTLEAKMTRRLAQLEKLEAEGKFGETPLWFKSALDLLAFYEKQLKKETNEARRGLLKDAIAKMTHHLYGIEVEKRIPIHAVFGDRHTSQLRPITLFLAPGSEIDPENPHVWYLIDLTYPAFYATYKGKGKTAHEAIAAAFEDARTSFRGNYPPGYILAHIQWPGMERYGLEAWDFITPTESWQRTAYEWASTAATVVGAAGLAAAFLFPPSAVVAKVLLIGAVIGATLSALNIIERIRTDNFEWDVETFSDIANIAAAFAGVGAAAAQSKAASLSSAIAKGELVTAEAGSRVAQVLKFQKFMLYTSLGTDITNGMVLAYDTYLQLKTLDMPYDEETRKEYERLYEKDAYKRWQEERYIRILSVLARAAVNGTLIVVSARSTRKQIGELGTLQRSPGAGESEIGESQRRSGVEPETEPPAESPAPEMGAGGGGGTGTGGPQSGPTLHQRQRAAALRRQAAAYETQATEHEARAADQERRATIAEATRPDRAARLREAASAQRDEAARLRNEATRLHSEAEQYASGTRSATQDLPGPEDVDQLFARATAEIKPVKVPLATIERNPGRLLRLVRALLRSKSGNRVVYRVEGGGSRELLHIDANGNVFVRPGETIYLNFGSEARAIEFLRENRGPGARIVAFEVDEEWVRAARSAAIPEYKTEALQGRQPRLVDVTVAEDQLEIPGSTDPKYDLTGELQDFIIPGTGRILNVE